MWGSILSWAILAVDFLPTWFNNWRPSLSFMETIDPTRSPSHDRFGKFIWCWLSVSIRSSPFFSLLNWFCCDEWLETKLQKDHLERRILERVVERRVVILSYLQHVVSYNFYFHRLVLDYVCYSNRTLFESSGAINILLVDKQISSFLISVISFSFAVVWTIPPSDFPTARTTSGI